MFVRPLNLAYLSCGLWKENKKKCKKYMKNELFNIYIKL